MQIITRALAVLGILALTGCSCGVPYGPYEPYDGGFPSELPDDARPITEDELAEYTGCAAHDGGFSEDRLVEVTAQLADRADGLVEVGVSDDGCVRFVRDLREGVLARAEFLAFTGEIVFAIDGEDVVYGARFVRIAHWERETDGTLRGRIDDDDAVYEAADALYEVETIERDGYYRVSRTNPASLEVEWQLTIDAASGERIQTTERIEDGALAVVDRTSLDVENELGGAPTANECIDGTVACDAATTAALDAALARSLARGTSCMAGLNDPDSAYETDTWLRLQALKNLWTAGREWGCMPAGCTFGHWCESCGAGSVDRIDIGYGEWSALPNPSVQLGILFHEFMHGVIGGHLDVIVNSPIESPATRRDRLMRRYVDRVDACEAYCFAETPTKCACATCLETDTCDTRCSGLASCVENDCTGSGGCVPIMSEAVGAACVITAADGEESATWSPTMDACRMSGCESAMGGTCRSYSRSCEPGCE